MTDPASPDGSEADQPTPPAGAGRTVDSPSDARSPDEARTSVAAGGQRRRWPWLVGGLILIAIGLWWQTREESLPTSWVVPTDDSIIGIGADGQTFLTRGFIGGPHGSQSIISRRSFALGTVTEGPFRFWLAETDKDLERMSAR